MVALFPRVDDGLLPLWLYFISLVSIGNTIQTYTSTTGSRRVYAAKPSEVTALSARTFGTWTLLSAIIRLTAAFDTSNPSVYGLALATFGLAFAHFGSEWLVYGTAEWGRGLAGPAVVATGSLAWMGLQWGHYVS